MIKFMKRNLRVYTSTIPLSRGQQSKANKRIQKHMVSVSVSRCIKKQKVCFVTHSFLDNVWDYPKFQGFSVNDCDIN